MSDQIDSGAMPDVPAPILVPISPGELIDKITILQIKRERISDPARCQNVEHELNLLEQASDNSVSQSEEIVRLGAELKRVNQTLWEIEDEIRVCERNGDFGGRFIELARSIYKNNDRRSTLKRAINEQLGSRILEEKSYTHYNPEEI